MDTTSVRRLWTLLGFVAALMALALVAAPSAHACSCAGYSFEEAVEAADLIADVTVEHAVGGTSDGEVTYLLVVDRVWKGEESRTIHLTTHQQTTACGLGAIPEGEELQLWASGSDGEYSTTWCALPMDGTGDDGERLTAALGAPADLTDQPVPASARGPLLSSEEARIATAVAGLLGAGVLGLRVTTLAVAMVLILRRR